MGVYYQIKSASTPRIWEDPWVLDLPNFRPLRQDLLDQYISLICELMNEDGKGWDVNLIKETFSQQEPNAILKIDISDTTEQDDLIWYSSMLGIVQSGLLINGTRGIFWPQTLEFLATFGYIFRIPIFIVDSNSFCGKLCQIFYQPRRK